MAGGGAMTPPCPGARNAGQLLVLAHFAHTKPWLGLSDPRYHMPVIPTLRKWRQGDQNFYEQTLGQPGLQEDLVWGMRPFGQHSPA